MFRLKPAVVLFLLSLVPSSIQQAQNFLPAAASSSFPQCAYACTLLEQAQTICLPPSAPVTSQAIYNSCFCQSGLLQPFYSSPNGVCDQFCPNPADLVTLQNWYKGFCAAQNQATTSTTTVAPSTSSVSTSAITAIATSNTGSGSTSSQNTSNSQSQSWFSSHWRWVLMLILLIILLPAFAFLAIYLKRRSARKRDAAQLAHNGGLPPTETSEYHHHNFFGGRWRNRKDSHGKTRDIHVNEGSHARDLGNEDKLARRNTAGTMSSFAGKAEMWGPHQSMAHTRGLGDYSQEDLAQASSSSSTRPGAPQAVTEKAAERRAERAAEGTALSTAAARAALSPTREDENTRSGNRKDRRKRHSGHSERHGHGRSQGHHGKGKERGVTDDVWEDETESAATAHWEGRAREAEDKRKKRRSRSQRERGENREERDREDETNSRFSM